MAKAKQVRVRVPASSANLGAGFDAVALALGLYLQCTLRTAPDGLRFRASGAEPAGIPCDASNLIWKTFARSAGESAPRDVELEIVNDIPLGRGLGSSASAIVAGLALANAWCGFGQTADQLLEAACRLEGHPDNVAAAIFGGLVVSCQTEDGHVLAARCPIDAALQAVLVIPALQLSTEAARAVLPAHVPRADAVFNLQRAALLVAALQNGRADLLAEAMRDRLHQPYREPLIPGIAEALRMRGVPGLLGVALSGAGPTVVAFCKEHAAEVGDALAACFRRHGVAARAVVLPVETQGLTVESVS